MKNIGNQENKLQNPRRLSILVRLEPGGLGKVTSLGWVRELGYIELTLVSMKGSYILIPGAALHWLR